MAARMAAIEAAQRSSTPTSPTIINNNNNNNMGGMTIIPTERCGCWGRGRRAHARVGCCCTASVAARGRWWPACMERTAAGVPRAPPWGLHPQNTVLVPGMGAPQHQRPPADCGPWSWLIGCFLLPCICFWWVPAGVPLRPAACAAILLGDPLHSSVLFTRVELPLHAAPSTAAPSLWWCAREAEPWGRAGLALCMRPARGPMQRRFTPWSARECV